MAGSLYNICSWHASHSSLRSALPFQWASEFDLPLPDDKCTPMDTERNGGVPWWGHWIPLTWQWVGIWQSDVSMSVVRECSLIAVTTGSWWTKSNVINTQCLVIMKTNYQNREELPKTSNKTKIFGSAGRLGSGTLMTINRNLWSRKLSVIRLIWWGWGVGTILAHCC